MAWKKKELIGGLFALSVIDLLFFPRILFALGISIAYLVIPVILLIGNSKFKIHRLMLILLMVIILLISLFYGQEVIKNTDFTEDFKRVGQLSILMLFSLLPFVKVHLSKELANKIINLFYFYNIVLLGLFIFSSGAYTSYMELIYPECLEQIEENTYSYRYSYVFTDPNTLGYMLVLIFSSQAIINNLKISELKTALTLVLLISTQSRGAFFAFLCCLLYLSIIEPKLYFKKYLTIGFFLVAVSIFIDLNPILLLFDLLETRSKFEQEVGLSFGGGRVEKYLYFFSQLSFIPFGSGYTLYRDGQVFLPHSDLIRIILSYGYLALIIFIYMINYKFKHRFIVYVSIATPFLINTLIDDFRLLPLFFVLVTLIINTQMVSSDETKLDAFEIPGSKAKSKIKRYNFIAIPTRS
jgi:hypothetical protein